MLTAERRAAVNARIKQIVRTQIAHATTLQDVWSLYRASTLSPEVSEADERARERAFYTGASCAANLVLKALDIEDDTEAKARLDALYQEFWRFTIALERGRG